jgi:hypothetical protein
MFTPKILTDEEKKKVKGGAPNCNCWWDIHSQCEHERGCITASWNSIKKLEPPA